MNKLPKNIPIMLFFVGAALGFALSGLSTWADIEANFYGFTRLASARFHGLTCPVMMAQNESRAVTIRVTNYNENPVSPVVRTEVSTPILPVEFQDELKLAPGESVTLTKQIGAENVDLKNFIFVKTLVFSAYPTPNQENTCGIFVLPMNGNGTVLFVAGIILSLLLTGGSAYLLHQQGISDKLFGLLIFVALLIFLAIPFGFLGLWIPNALAVITLFLTLMIAIGNFLTP